MNRMILIGIHIGLIIAFMFSIVYYKTDRFQDFGFKQKEKSDLTYEEMKKLSKIIRENQNISESINSSKK